MSQTSCERCGFPIPMRWLHAGGALFPPYSIHQRASGRSERAPKRLLHSPELPCLRTRTPNCASATSIIKVRAGIKSP
jgi:hypothetical protein